MTLLWERTATELSELLARGEVTSREIVAAHLSRIEEVDEAVRAFTKVFATRAHDAALRSDERRARGEVLSPLDGLPVSVKECFDIAGEATTLGIPAWSNRVATRSAAMVRALEQAGAVILGRTNLSQTMLFAESRNPIFGQTSNPFSLRHSPGGSSGGEAAAVASGMSPLGIGTDLGGSIRTPAHVCGLVALKPTLDRLPADGIATVLAGQEAVRSQNGPIARCVADLRLLFDALDPAMLTHLDARVPPLAMPVRRGAGPLRIGYFIEDRMLRPSRAIARAVEEAAAFLKEAGHTLVAFAPPAIESTMALYLGALSADGGATLLREVGDGPLDRSLRSLKRIALLPSPLRRALARGFDVTGERSLGLVANAVGRRSVRSYWEITRKIRGYRRLVLEKMAEEEIDLILSPPYATPALPHGLSENFALAASWSILWNVTQMPAGVVPITRVQRAETVRRGGVGKLEEIAARVDAESAGLPVGVQLVARPWEEVLLLDVMQGLEERVRVSGDAPATPVVRIV